MDFVTGNLNALSLWFSPTAPLKGRHPPVHHPDCKTTLTVVFPHSPFEGSVGCLWMRGTLRLSLWFSPTAPLKAVRLKLAIDTVQTLTVVFPHSPFEGSPA